MRWINSRAGRYPFRPMAWDEIAEQGRDFAEANPRSRVLVDVIDSVRDRGGRERLAGTWTVDGLAVTPLPVPDEPPIQQVVVSFPGQGETGGEVLIEHRSTSGHDDRVVRPSAEAVSLFWRFMIEKFGIAPAPR